LTDDRPLTHGNGGDSNGNPGGPSLSPRLDHIGRLSIWVYFIDHQRPHIQVRGPGIRANIDIGTGEVLAGRLPPKDLRQLRAWMAPRRDALRTAFFAALRHDDPTTLVTRYKEATDGI
jgi:hypothetical protein